MDIAFSIMQSCDITFDTTAFKTNIRLEATVALASEILCRGKTADGLDALFMWTPVIRSAHLGSLAFR